MVLNFLVKVQEIVVFQEGNHGYVYLSKDDLKKLANFFNQNKNEFKKKYCKITNGFIHLKEFKKN